MKIRITKTTMLGWPGLPRMVQPGETYDATQRQRDVLVSAGYAEDVKPAKKATNERKTRNLSERQK